MLKKCLFALLLAGFVSTAWATASITVSSWGADPVGQITQVVTAGTTGTPIILHGRTPMITAIPGGGGTLAIQYSTSSVAAILSATATWQNWSSGTVSSTTSDSPTGPITAIKATAATADGTVEIVQ